MPAADVCRNGRRNFFPSGEVRRSIGGQTKEIFSSFCQQQREATSKYVISTDTDIRLKKAFSAKSSSFVVGWLVGWLVGGYGTKYNFEAKNSATSFYCPCRRRSKSPLRTGDKVPLASRVYLRINRPHRPNSKKKPCDISTRQQHLLLTVGGISIHRVTRKLASGLTHSSRNANSIVPKPRLADLQLIQLIPQSATQNCQRDITSSSSWRSNRMIHVKCNCFCEVLNPVQYNAPRLYRLAKFPIASKE